MNQLPSTSSEKPSDKIRSVLGRAELYETVRAEWVRHIYEVNGSSHDTL